MQEDFPLVDELSGSFDAPSVFRALASLPHCLFLDSALAHSRLGRYSFIAADPFDFRRTGSSDDPLGRVAASAAEFRSAAVENLPPFQGGVAGLLGYDLNRSLERIPAPRFDEFGCPWLALGFYDVVIAFDHQQRRGWLISQGFPEVEPRRRRARAASRMQFFRDQLAARRDTGPWAIRPSSGASLLTPDQLSPQYPFERTSGLTSNFTRQGFLRAVERAIEYIHAGDIFQVNLAQRILFPARDDAISLYLRLRERNPATFAGYFDLGDFQIVSASPERFLAVQNGQVEARPIKGTRQRTARPEADLFAADDLRQSEKDRAENVMIVDLLRNDLSRVCRPDSVHVTQLFGLEVYQFVQHLVSAVCGDLDVGRTAWDLIRAAFPGGSITGAPKVRAMEIIAELEKTSRGPYCGSLGYVGFDGSSDFNILIRTITAGRGWWQFPVGGGIVAQSNPRDEYEETCHKAAGLVRALVP